MTVRLHVDACLAEGADVAVSPAQAHYLGSVMRLGPGDPVILFNGRDGEWASRLAEVTRKAARLVVETRLRPQTPEPDVWLLFAPPKGPRLDFVTEKATELGAALLRPVFTRRSVVTRVNEEKMRAHLIEAAEQCERLTVPVLAPPAPLDRALAEWPSDRRLFVLAEHGPSRPLAEALTPGPAGFLVGPEGGFDKTELDALAGLPFAVAVGLGPRILRAETAALAALACWQARHGDWAASPAFRS
ncbi:MAG: 16S rRNA (uracil(1498)-N(3))-methyltransferase [Alphaproteobacteria bacterium]|nr:16S rRNA (uracil(1498)-N(3))-methyltransferase [Alphaproteobacteria bacterium]